MGFFSVNCSACGHSLRDPNSVNSVSRWMNEVVVQVKGEPRPVIGKYDGYGRVSGQSDAGFDYAEAIVGISERSEAWHEACWKLVGKPRFQKPARSANDQGSGVQGFDPAPPKSREDLAEMNALAEADRLKQKAEWEAILAEMQGEKKAALLSDTEFQRLLDTSK
jgi:hypothetical protein